MTSYFTITMAPASVNNQFQIPTILVLPGIDQGVPRWHVGWPPGALWGAGAHQRGQKCFHTLFADRATLNVSSASAVPPAIYSHKRGKRRPEAELGSELASERSQLCEIWVSRLSGPGPAA